jgi:hypothetical protein
VTNSVDPNLTQAVVQRQITDYLTQVLGVLPAQLTLSQASPTPGKDPFDPNIAVPCDDNDQTATGPLNVQDSYWVHGMGDGQQQATLDAISAAFTEKGWTVTNDNNGSIRGFTPDGYALIADLNTVGELSLSGSTPCFPRANADAKAIGTSSIAHP